MDSASHIYSYRAFGLNIRSEIEFPELLTSASQDADILITKAKKPIEGWSTDGRNAWQFNMQRFRMRLAGIADYDVNNGSRIDVYPATGAELSQIRIHLLTVCMAAALMQRGLLLLHASGVVHKGRTVLFAGDSGAGKSSVAAGMRQKGYDLLTDDTCVVEILPGPPSKIIAHPSYPMIKLTSDALESLQDPRYDKSLRIWPDIEKFGQLLHAEAQRDGATLRGIIILGYAELENQKVSCRNLSGNQAFLSLVRHTYRKEFIHELDLQQAHLKTMGMLASTVSVLELTRPREMTLGEFCNQLEILVAKHLE